MRWKAVAALVVGIAVEGAAVAAGLTADQIVEKNVAAHGGLEAWRKIDTMVWVGHMESARAGVPSMQFVLQQKRPNKMRFEVNSLGERTLRVFDGAHGWKLKPNRAGKVSVEPYTPQEVTFAFRSQCVDGPLIDYRAKDNVVVLEGMDEIEGHKAFRLRLSLASGETDRLWVDAETFLEIRYDRPSYGPSEAPATVSMFYRGYQTVDGLRIPSVIETAGGPGAPPDRMVIDKVMLNAPVDDRTFAQPRTHEQRGMAMGGQSHPPARRAPIDPSGAAAASSQNPAAGPASGPN